MKVKDVSYTFMHLADTFILTFRRGAKAILDFQNFLLLFFIMYYYKKGQYASISIKNICVVKRLIVINRIQNNGFCLYYMCVYIYYVGYIYKYTHACIYLRKMWYVHINI